MTGSILSVHVVDARDLRGPNGRRVQNAFARLSIEGQSAKTQQIPGTTDPVWNEIIAFDIKKGDELLKVSVQDMVGSNKELIGELEIDLKDLSRQQHDWLVQYPDVLEKIRSDDFDNEVADAVLDLPEPPEIDQMKKDELYELQSGQGQIRIALQWIYSKVKLLDDINLALKFQIKYDKIEKINKEKLLDMMQNPFGGFIKTQFAYQAMNLGDQNLAQIVVQFGTVSEQEMEMHKKVNARLAKAGFRDVKWARITFILTVLYTIMTCLVHFYKADFVNITCCAIAIYLLSNASSKQGRQFRHLVAGVVLSLAYDVIWFYMRFGELVGDAEEEGGVEQKVRRFSLWMSIISFFFKILMTFVFWMASIKFEDIIDERSALL